MQAKRCAHIESPASLADIEYDHAVFDGPVDRETQEDREKKEQARFQ